MSFRQTWTCAGLSRRSSGLLQYFTPWQQCVLLIVTMWSQLTSGVDQFLHVVLECFLISRLFILHQVKSYIEFQLEEDCQRSCIYSIFLRIALTVDLLSLSYCSSSQSCLGERSCSRCPLTALWSMVERWCSLSVWGCGQLSFIQITSLNQVTLIQEKAGL